MISLDDLRSSIDLYRGCVSFSLPLCSLMGGAGPQLDLALQYDGNVTHEATTWNMTAPTGVLGLGWSLPVERISVRFDHNTASADQEIILTTSGGSTRLLQTGQVSSDVLSYATEDYRFWKIQRFLSTERWEITREDGVKYVYGDTRSRRSTVEYGVCWGNWIGSTSNLDTQQLIAVAWDLSQVIDLWDNTVTFKYAQVMAPVGGATGLSYTQAIYIDEIVGAAGDRAVFHRDNKTTKEYQDPHTTPPPPNAWQDRFETQFLDRIEVFSPTNELMYTAKFDFTDGQGNTVFLGTGQLTKRLLMGVKTQYPGALNDLPAVKFTYVMSNTDPAYGSIATVTTPAGGVNTYTYTANNDLDLCDRTKALAPPSGATYTQPRIWFEKDYVVVTWLSDNQQAQIMAYSWEGRWLESKLDSLAVPTGADYANLQVKTAKSNFVVVAGTNAVAYYRDVTSPGSWISSNVVALMLTSGEPVVTASGDGFSAVLGQNSGKLNRLRFNGTIWVTDMIPLPGGGTPGFQSSMAARHNFLFTASVLGNDSTDRLHLRIDYLDALTQWQSALSTSTRSQNTITGLTVYAGDTYAVVVSAAPANGYAYSASYWSANYDNIQSKLLLQLTSATAPAPELHGAFVGIGQQLFRFDGQQWGQQNVASITYSNPQTVTGISYGFDQVLRTILKNDGQQVFDLIAYNPNQSQSTTPWSVPPNMGPVAPGTGNYTARAARSDDHQSLYVLLPAVGTPSRNVLYYQQPSGIWNLVLQIPDSLTATELGSLQVLDELYCIYQSGANTIVYPLQNGGVTGRISLNEQLLVPNASPTMLVGQEAFITYTGNWGQPGSTINLHRIVRQNITGKLQVVAVNIVQQDTGYQNEADAQGRLITAYAFARSNATIDSSGYQPAYNLATSAANTANVANAPQGTTQNSFFNDLRLNEAPVTPPYPTNPQPQDQFTNATQFLRLLRGRTYATQLKSSDSSAPPVSTSTTYWWVFTQSITIGGERAFYKRFKKTDTTLNQVPGTTETTFDPLTGLPNQITTYQFNSQATKDTLVVNLKYWWEQYNQNRDLNLLSPIIETIESTNGVRTVNAITTWSNDWGFIPAHWSQSATYIATTPNPGTFNKWNPNNDPLAAGWLLQTQVVERNGRGLVLRSIDVLGRWQSAVLDSSGRLPIAAFFNADSASSEAGYYGFEIYEDNPDWSYTGGFSINDFIISGWSHTGSRCLQFTPDPTGTIGPISTWLNTSGSGSFVFSCWMLVPAGSNANINNAYWSLQLETVGPSPAPVGPPFKLAFPAATGKWAYIHHITNLGKYRQQFGQPTAPLQMTIKGVNQSNTNCLVDELRFSAVDGSYSALVYDASMRRISATLGENGATMRPVQDVYDRDCALIGPDENVATLNIPAFSRMQSADKNFDPKLPNSELRIMASSDGLYYDFDPSDIPDWTLPANWTIAAGQLTFNGHVSDTTPPFGSPAQLKTQSLTNFAARVRFHANGTVPYAGIGLDNLCVFWDVSEASWIIDYKKDGNWFGAAIRHVPFGEDWVLAVVDNLVLFYVDGSQVFAFQMTEVAPAGFLTMYLNGPGSFEQLVISINPQLSLRFTDGAGQFLQQLSLVDNQTVVITGMLPDVTRRPQREKNTVQLGVDIVPPPPPPGVSGPDQARVIGDISTYLAGANNQPVPSLSDYLALNPPPYSQVAYEDSPLSRPTRMAQPGIAIDSPSHVRTMAYAQYVPNSVMRGLGFDSAASNYLLITVKDENGVNSYSLFNSRNQLLAQQVDVTPAGQTEKKYNSQKVFYDGAGDIITVQLPNFFDPPAGSQSQDWMISRSFTFLRQIETITTPDSGQKQFKYDNVGRLCFILDANGAALSPQRILYFQYDDLDRVIETGYVQNANVNWSNIPQYAPYTFPQGVVPVWSNRYTFDDNCVDSTDYASCQQADNLIGRLWRAQTNSEPPATPDVEIFSYDRRGRVLTIRTAVARYDSNTYQSAFRYNNLNQLIETTYPRPLSPSGEPIGDEFKVGRFFDRLGRLAGVGEHPRGNEVFDPRNPIDNSPYAEKYAAFAYNFQSLLSGARFNNANAAAVINRGYAYDLASRLTQITGDYHNQVLTYETGGFNGAGYFNGQIASSQTAYYAAAGADRFRAPVISDSRWAYSYDNLGRLVVASNSNQPVDSALNFGGTIAAVYDANGNLLTVPRGAATENYNYQTSIPEPEDASQ